MGRVAFRSLFAASSAFALTEAAPALAQTAAPAAATVTTAAPAPAPSAVAEVVVTAQKRSQNVQDVPVAVSVVSA
ncbi:MAG: hypothetical protein ACYDD1_16895, partial [Caulobacteraceae bacterium]